MITDTYAVCSRRRRLMLALLFIAGGKQTGPQISTAIDKLVAFAEELADAGLHKAVDGGDNPAHVLDQRQWKPRS